MPPITKPPAATDAPGLKKLGRYECTEQLGGEGGFETYRARVKGLTGLDRSFAVKVLRLKRSETPNVDQRAVSASRQAQRNARGSPCRQGGGGRLGRRVGLCGDAIHGRRGPRPVPHACTLGWRIGRGQGRGGPPLARFGRLHRRRDRARPAGCPRAAATHRSRRTFSWQCVHHFAGGGAAARLRPSCLSSSSV